MTAGSSGARGYAVKYGLSRHPVRALKQQLLGHLDIELTERCNNACSHCYINLAANDRDAWRRELTTAQWRDILHQAADLGALSVRLTGGEPLLRPDFADIYLFARRLGMQVVLFTNARLITPALADLLAKVPPLKRIEISVYGTRPESYDAVAGIQGAFDEFRRGVVLLHERRIPFELKFVFMPQTIAEIDRFEKWAATMPRIAHGAAYPTLFDFRTRRDSLAKNRQIEMLRLSPMRVVAARARQEPEYRRGTARFCARFVGASGDKLFACGAGTSGCVDAYGTYQMCMLLRHPEMVYDLNRGSLREALGAAFPRLREARATNPEYLSRCARCFLKGLCEQCPAKSWAEHGTLDAPVEYLCQVAHAEARYLGLLDSGEQAWEIADWRRRIARLVRDEETTKADPSRIMEASRC